MTPHAIHAASALALAVLIAGLCLLANRRGFERGRMQGRADVHEERGRAILASVAAPTDQEAE